MHDPELDYADGVLADITDLIAGYVREANVPMFDERRQDITTLKRELARRGLLVRGGETS